jgi:hypothetical protein
MLDRLTRRIAEVFDFDLWSAWFAELDRTFIFLLVLPFVIAVIGLWAWFIDEDRK